MEGHAMDMYLLWALAGMAAVLILMLAAVALRRRLKRGHPARFSIGLSLIDVIEGLSGRELSSRTQATIVGGSLVVALLIVVVVFYLLTQALSP
jgi:hypothetical protein